MTTLVLDSGGVTALADRRQVAKVRALLELDAWPPVVPSIVIAECTTGQPQDANTNALLKRCVITDEIPVVVARRAGALRFRAGQGSAVDALVVAIASGMPDPIILTSDPDCLAALAANSSAVRIHAV